MNGSSSTRMTVPDGGRGTPGGPGQATVSSLSKVLACFESSSSPKSLHLLVPLAAQVLLVLLGVPPTSHNDEVAAVNEPDPSPSLRRNTQGAMFLDASLLRASPFPPLPATLAPLASFRTLLPLRSGSVISGRTLTRIMWGTLRQGQKTNLFDFDVEPGRCKECSRARKGNL